jgi:hypothetical protein
MDRATTRHPKPKGLERRQFCCGNAQKECDHVIPLLHPITSKSLYILFCVGEAPLKFIELLF